MLKSILAVDSLAIQRSLTILEDRYRELLQIGERRFEAWEGETTELKQQLADQSEKLQQAQKARDEQIARVKGLEAELAKLTDERDAAASDKTAVLQSAAELKQQLADQSEKLQQAQKARDEQIARVKGLEAELIKLKMDREGIVAGLQRLRHAARGAATLTVQ